MRESFYDYVSMEVKVKDYLIQQEVQAPSWGDSTDEELLVFHANVLRAMRALGFDVAEEDRQGVVQVIAKRIIGLGILQSFLEMEDVEEIIVRNGFVWIARSGQIENRGLLAPDRYFFQMIQSLAGLHLESLSIDDMPVILTLPDGSILTAVIPPFSRSGTAITDPDTDF
jgi:Flp pilus assembly CpaF family ATPase